jgi:hypothetical protein
MSRGGGKRRRVVVVVGVVLKYGNGGRAATLLLVNNRLSKDAQALYTKRLMVFDDSGPLDKQS